MLFSVPFCGLTKGTIRFHCTIYDYIIYWSLVTVIGQGGEEIHILTVAGRTYSHMDISAETDLTNVKVLFTHKTD